MSYQNYLFGNVDENGNLEGDLDEELVNNLNYITQTENIFNENNIFKELINKENTKNELVKPNKDATDYSNLEELALDEEVDNNNKMEEYFEEDDYEEDDDDNEESEEERSDKETINIKEVYPDFKENNETLKFTKIFSGERETKKEKQITTIDKKTKNFVEKLRNLKPLKDKKDLKNKAYSKVEEYLGNINSVNNNDNKNNDNNESWDVEKVKTIEGVKIPHRYFEIDYEPIKILDPNKTTIKEPSSLVKFNNYEVNSLLFSKNIIRDFKDKQQIKTHFESNLCRLNLSLNDQNMLFEPTRNNTGKSVKYMGNDMKTYKIWKKAKRLGLKEVSFLEKYVEDDIINEFNLSNDVYYQALSENRTQRIRQTFGQLEAMHSLPALKTSPPFFKTLLGKNELRSFHRPIIKFAPKNAPLRFTSLSNQNELSLRPKRFQQYIQSADDITLRDDSKFILLEYCEEFPPVIQNTSMGSVFINYYRKTDSEDNNIPQSSIGEVMILDVSDASPFLSFGNIEPGESMLVMHNNLYKVPIFKQKVNRTDFVVVKAIHRANTNYYIREIPEIYVLGQVFPSQEVPGPRSRKVAYIIKHRLLVAAYRQIKGDAQRRLNIKRLSRLFPEYSEAQIKGKLRDMPEFQRVDIGNNESYWTAKDLNNLPLEDDLQKMITPEMICLYESMLVGQRYLLDAGYGQAADEDINEDESKLDVEEKLAPWITTRNFLSALEGKTMLELDGPGDPTGCGQGFSFIKTSMKDLFLKSGETMEQKLSTLDPEARAAHKNSVIEQQNKYKQKINDIWNFQKQCLSSREATKTNFHDLKRLELPNKTNNENYLTDNTITQKKNRSLSFNNAENDYRFNENEEFDDAASFTGSIASRSSFNKNQNKVLTIKREYINSEGEKYTKTETVRNPVIINAYLKQRKYIEECVIDPKKLEPNEDIERNNRIKRRIESQLDKLKRNKERRTMRRISNKDHSQSAVTSRHNSISANTIDLSISPQHQIASNKDNKNTTTIARRCGNCGQMGHVKTNKRCPLFYENNKNQNSAKLNKPLVRLRLSTIPKR